MQNFINKIVSFLGMPEVIGDLSDLILDLKFVSRPNIAKLNNHNKSTWYNTIQKIVSKELLTILSEGNAAQRTELAKRLNNFLDGKLKRGYEENGSCYIELFNKEGSSDLYYIADAQEDRKYYSFAV